MIGCIVVLKSLTSSQKGPSSPLATQCSATAVYCPDDPACCSVPTRGLIGAGPNTACMCTGQGATVCSYMYVLSALPEARARHCGCSGCLQDCTAHSAISEMHASGNDILQMLLLLPLLSPRQHWPMKYKTGGTAGARSPQLLVATQSAAMDLPVETAQGMYPGFVQSSKSCLPLLLPWGPKQACMLLAAAGLEPLLGISAVVLTDLCCQHWKSLLLLVGLWQLQCCLLDLQQLRVMGML